VTLGPAKAAHPLEGGGRRAALRKEGQGRIWEKKVVRGIKKEVTENEGSRKGEADRNRKTMSMHSCTQHLSEPKETSRAAGDTGEGYSSSSRPTGGGRPTEAGSRARNRKAVASEKDELGKIGGKGDRRERGTQQGKRWG